MPTVAKDRRAEVKDRIGEVQPWGHEESPDCRGGWETLQGATSPPVWGRSGRSCLAPSFAPEGSFSSQNSRPCLSEQKGAFCALGHGTFQSLTRRGQTCERWRGALQEKASLLKMEWGRGEKARHGRCWVCVLIAVSPDRKRHWHTGVARLLAAEGKPDDGLEAVICSGHFAGGVLGFLCVLWSDKFLSRVKPASRKESVSLKSYWSPFP